MRTILMNHAPLILTMIIESILSFGTILPLLAFGVAAIIRKKRPFVLPGGLMMFVFSALGPATGNTDFIFLISVIGEWLMVVFFCRRGVGFFCVSFSISTLACE